MGTMGTRRLRWDGHDWGSWKSSPTLISRCFRLGTRLMGTEVMGWRVDLGISSNPHGSLMSDCERGAPKGRAERREPHRAVSRTYRGDYCGTGPFLPSPSHLRPGRGFTPAPAPSPGAPMGAGGGNSGSASRAHRTGTGGHSWGKEVRGRPRAPRDADGHRVSAVRGPGGEDGLRRPLRRGRTLRRRRTGSSAPEAAATAVLLRDSPANTPRCRRHGTRSAALRDGPHRDDPHRSHRAALTAPGHAEPRFPPRSLRTSPAASSPPLPAPRGPFPHRPPADPAAPPAPGGLLPAPTCSRRFCHLPHGLSSRISLSSSLSSSFSCAKRASGSGTAIPAPLRSGLDGSGSATPPPTRGRTRTAPGPPRGERRGRPAQRPPRGSEPRNR